MHRSVQIIISIMLLLAITGCGGSSGGSNASVSFDSTSVKFTGSMSNETYHELGFTLKNMPDEGIYIKQLSSDNAALTHSDANMITDSRGTVYMTFAAGAYSMGPGEVSGTMKVAFCHDTACNNQIAGSPINLTITVNYEESAVVNYPNELAVSTEQLQNDSTVKLLLELDNPGKDTLYTRYQITGDGPLSSVGSAMLTTGNIELALYFNTYYNKFGMLRNTLTVKTCYDYGCTMPITDSEVTIEISVDNRATDTAGEPVTIVQQQALPFEMLHSEFMPVNNAIAITSSWPENALYILNLADFTHTKVSLAKTPTSVAVSGNEVAVGHDAMVTHVSFATAQPKLTLLNAPVAVFDIALTSNKVHVTAAGYNWSDLISIDINSNTFSNSVNGSLYSGSKIAAHPTQPWIYAANNGLSPDDIDKVDVSTSPATVLYDSPYHGDYAFCGDLWISEDGLRVYTPCGNTFRLSANRDVDLTYTGKIGLSNDFRLKHIVESISDNEVTLIEKGPYSCEWGYEQCFTRISSYNREFLSNRQLRTVPGMFVNDEFYVQEAQAVYYNQDKSKRYMLSKLVDMPSLAATFYIAEIAF